jgi:pyruvate dehydrogenase E2 component (dihydrolipoamide acetyltransferase)
MADMVMPRLSDTMEEGTILRWLKSDGEQVRRGEELVEIETDKATMSYESDEEGILRIVAPEGATLAVGELIAHIGGDGQAAPASEAPQHAPSGDGRTTARDVGPKPAARQTPAGEEAPQQARVKVSPLARRIAGESGVDLRGLTGTGPGGRIVKADVLAPAAAVVRVPASPGPAAGIEVPSGSPGIGANAASESPDVGSGATLEGVTTAKGQTTDVELSRVQQTIARRMAESKATIPDFTLLIDVDMEESVKLRAELKRLSVSGADAGAESGGSREGARRRTPTYNDMVVKACALALRDHPTANGSYRDGRLQLHSRVNVGVAVAAEDALVVPTVFDADEKSLGEIARETHALAERVRAGTITPPELGGGTFTVSNLGMYGVKSFTAIINPPQAAILSVGSVEPRAVMKDAAVVSRHTMTLTLVCDHRILYGAEAARFLARVRELLQAPSSLTL